jgi:hypothetical protein
MAMKRSKMDRPSGQVCRLRRRPAFRRKVDAPPVEYLVVRRSDLDGRTVGPMPLTDTGRSSSIAHGHLSLSQPARPPAIG